MDRFETVYSGKMCRQLKITPSPSDLHFMPMEALEYQRDELPVLSKISLKVLTVKKYSLKKNHVPIDQFVTNE